MPIAIACLHCDWKGNVADDLAGRKGKCPTCGEQVPVPRRKIPPPIPGCRRPDDGVSDLVTDADIIEDKPLPKRPARQRDEDRDRPSRGGRRRNDDDEDDRPARSRRRSVDDDDDDRVRKARRRLASEVDDVSPRRQRSGGPRHIRRSTGSGRSKAIVGGIGLIVLAIVLFAFFFFVLNRIWFYPIFLVIGGVVSLIRGLTSPDSDGGEYDDDDDY
jgi:hypothetical protein